MDYKYIEQLMELYWECETTLEEEHILRTFFAQESVPASLLPYKDLFTYGLKDQEEHRLGDDFDRRMLDLIGEPAPVKARTIHLTERLMPLFKAAAIVAIILTLGNAAQVAFQPKAPVNIANADEYTSTTEGVSVAKVDTMKQDSMRTVKMTEVTLIK